MSLVKKSINTSVVILCIILIGIMLIFPVSAGFPHQNYSTAVNGISKLITTQTNSFSLKNSFTTTLPQVVPSKPITTIESQTFGTSKSTNFNALIHPTPTIIPLFNNDAVTEDPYMVTVTVWDKDHLHPVPDATLTFERLIIPASNGQVELTGFTSKVIAVGKSDKNGRYSIVLNRNDVIEIDVHGPTVVENGEKVFYNNAQTVTYQSHSIDITLEGRNTAN